ncbi:hypothetical protein DL89DRAFT_275968 [Linderina pennispora]|uniref:HECT-type E3 ubiquitin transferase n=1 Tax=Linderina pennispora TaxID=61395 RepID=A0A1Y1VXL4_9FUNG|nr:uncharacterized protein DL89DRAFT_275968 [Linderina pennispora]ORX66021.1 hypothetical protein DL89DRAFT_275968 [Linderina pennispora]
MALLHAANLLLSSRSQLPVEAFYVQAIDNMNLIADYDAWRAQYPGAFSFCQYPFLLSLRAKVQIMQVDAARQMQTKVKEAVISGPLPANQPHLKLLVRRKCLVEDSLHQLASHEQDLKKRLKIEFVGEEGIDAGGLAKEWFMLLVRELMNPMYGMFRRESDDSSLASEENTEWGGAYWFNPASLETSNQYFLVGIVVGLALYNSTILDLNLPLAVFKKLLRTKFYANPTATSSMLADVAEFRPQFARGLRQLLAYRGQDVEDVFCLTFEATYNAYGDVITVPLVPNGSNIPVTSSNRVEYVMRYLQWILNDSIAKQFEPFKRGFFYVCGGNALSLFKPEEVELMVHGSDTDWDPRILQKITEYAGFGDYEEMLTSWFWEILNDMAPKERRAFLAFLKLVLLGDDFRRLPVAHTCFNQLGIWCYRSKDEFRDKLAMALTESEGFGLQ